MNAPARYICACCGRRTACLFPGDLCPACYTPETITDLPQPEKASFTIDINRRRAVIRWRKRGLRPPKTQKQIYQMRRNEAASRERWEAAHREQRKEYFKARYQQQKGSK